MAPTTNNSARRGRGGNGNRARRNAFTNAGVNRGQSRTPRGSHRARGAHRANTYRARDHSQASSRPSLASRITYDDAGAQNQTDSSGTNTSHHQSTDSDDDPGISIRGQANSAGQVNSHDPVPTEHDTPGAGATTMNNFDAEEGVDIDIDIDLDIDDMLFDSNMQHNANFSQQSALFCGSQPTQPTEPLPERTPSPAPTPTSALTTPPPPSRSTYTATSSTNRIRMANQPVRDANHGSPHTTPRRPVNTYRGNDPIKRLVQNKKLQAIFADRPVPKERTKSGHEKMELRMGMRSASK